MAEENAKELNPQGVTEFIPEDEEDLSNVDNEDIDDSEEFLSQYHIEGTPDYIDGKVQFPDTVKDVEETPTKVKNDYFLHGKKQDQVTGISLNYWANKYKDYKIVSAYNKDTHEFEPFVKRFMPEHGESEGGKGFPNYTKQVIQHSAGFSAMSTFTLGIGCHNLESESNKVNTDLGVLPISKIIKENIQCKVETKDGKFSPVLNHYDNGIKEVFAVELEDGTYFEVTGEHPFQTEKDGKEVILSIAEIFEQKLPLLKKDKKLFILRIESLGMKHVGDIEIEHPHLFLMNGVVVHNCSGGCNFCFPKDSEVNKFSNGSLVKDVKVGDIIKSVSSDVTVEKITDTGVKEVFQFETEDKEVLELTEEHPVLVKDKDGSFKVVPIIEAFQNNLPLVRCL